MINCFQTLRRRARPYPKEAKINARETVMVKVNRALSGFVGVVNRVQSLTGRGVSNKSLNTVLTKSFTERIELPTLTAGSVKNLVDGLGRGDRIAMTDALAILQAAAVMFAMAPSVVDIEVPPDGKCVVVGDLHGQLAGHATPTLRNNSVTFFACVVPYLPHRTHGTYLSVTRSTLLLRAASLDCVLALDLCSY
jgi:hypothetical protein